MIPDTLDFLGELDFFRREALTAQQQFFAYLSLHKIAHENPAVLASMNREAIFWLTLRETALQGAFTSLGRIFDENSRHNVNALLAAVAKNLPAFSRVQLAVRKTANGVADDAAAEFVANKHDWTPEDLRKLRKRVSRQRKIWEARYRDIRSKIYAHSERRESGDLFAQTRIDEVIDMLDTLEGIYVDIWEGYHNGREPCRDQHRKRLFRLMPMSVRRAAARSFFGRRRQFCLDWHPGRTTVRVWSSSMPQFCWRAPPRDLVGGFRGAVENGLRAR